MKVRITAIPKVKTLQDALSNFSLRLAAPPPVFAADVVVARQMYFAALKVENRASRFLIIYAALAVFSTFKLGTRDRTQDRIDQILTAEDPALPMTTPHGRTRAETEFTRARNDFLYTQERGRTHLEERDIRYVYIRPRTPQFYQFLDQEGISDNIKTRATVSPES